MNINEFDEPESLIQSTGLVTIDPDAEEVVCNLLWQIFEPVAYLEPHTIRRNIELASGLMPMQDRMISVEMGDFLIENAAKIFVLLISDIDLRTAALQAVARGISAYDTAAIYDAAHANLGLGTETAATSEGYYVVDLSRYDDELFHTFIYRLQCSFDTVLTDLGDRFIDLISALGPDEKALIGFIASNFMYLIKAFATDEEFASICQPSQSRG